MIFRFAETPEQRRPQRCARAVISVAVAARAARRFAIFVLLLAVDALVLQVPAHANLAGHAAHQQRTAVAASHCERHHMPEEHGADHGASCAGEAVGDGLATCCQACLNAAIPIALPICGIAENGETFIFAYPDLREPTLEGILRPPRPFVA